MIDLGTAPPSNAYLARDRLHTPELYYPLRVMVCEQCWLVQTEDFARAEDLFDPNYAYFSAFSDSWLRHAESYVGSICALLDLGPSSRVVEIAANDGYLLQYVAARGIPCYGIEPTASTASAARAKGIEIVEDFFGQRLAEELVERGLRADLLIANNVLAHVPDINDFVAGFTRLLKPNGVATFEFPHLVQLIDHAQFDTIYHEHFSYLSLHAVERIFSTQGLTVFDVETIPTHGGSLRVYAQIAASGKRPQSHRVLELRNLESSRGVADRTYYVGLQRRAEQLKNDLLGFLINASRRDEMVAGYGAAAKGNTLLNFAGVRADLVSFVADRNPAKQGKYLPGSRIPILDESALRTVRPRWVLILPWNISAEIVTQLSYVSEWGGQFVVAVPALTVIPEARQGTFQ